MKAKVFVKLKNGVLDVQGKAILGSLNTLGFNEVSDVTQGKFIELNLNTKTKAEAQGRVEKMCQDLLTNTVIENYSYEITE